MTRYTVLGSNVQSYYDKGKEKIDTVNYETPTDIDTCNIPTVRVPTVDGTFSTFRTNFSTDAPYMSARCSSSVGPLVTDHLSGNICFCERTIIFY